MADLASQMNPPPGPQQGPPPSTPEEFHSLHSGWMDYLSHPATQAALLQFAASVVQPVDRGQSVIGNIGLAVGDAAQAAGRVQAGQAAAEQQAFANTQEERRTANQEAQTAEEAKRTKLEGQRIANEAAQQDRTYSLDLQRLGIEKSRADAYSHYIANLGGASTKKIPGYDIAIKTAIQGLDPEDPDFETKLGQLVTGVNQAFGVGGVPAAGGGMDRNSLLGLDQAGWQAIFADPTKLAAAQTAAPDLVTAAKGFVGAGQPAAPGAPAAAAPAIPPAGGTQLPAVGAAGGPPPAPPESKQQKLNALNRTMKKLQIMGASAEEMKQIQDEIDKVSGMP
jgi:hypothetical protein